MKIYIQTFRAWWQRPRKLTELEEERSVSFLELFYDLVYVVIVAELTHAFVAHISREGFITFVGLFVLVWLAWINGSYYHELHGNNDIRTRVFTFLQMFALAGMAIFAHNAIGDGYRGFALSYTAFLAIVTFLWWRTGVHDPEHRPLSDPYAFGFLITTLLFAASIFTSVHTGLVLWSLGTGISLLLPLVMIRTRARVSPEHLEAAQRMRPSIVERFGLLTIIVLGEVVVAVVQGGAHHSDIGLLVGAMIILGVAIAVGMWWVYFDFVSRRTPIQNETERFAWIYLHLPLTTSIALTGAGLLAALEHMQAILPAAERWLLVGSVAVFLLCVALLMKTIETDPHYHDMYTGGIRVMYLSALLMFLLGFTQMQTIPLLVVVTLLLLAPVYTAFRFWIGHVSEGH